MSSGLPVVAANAGGPSDIVENGESGFLVEPKNEQSFFEEMASRFRSLHVRSKGFRTRNARLLVTSQNGKHLCFLVRNSSEKNFRFCSCRPK